MNTIQTIAEGINAFAGKFKIVPEQVEVTSYEQMGDNVRVFYKLNTTFGKTPEEIKKIRQPIRLCNQLIVDPFKDGGTDPEPEPDVKPTSVTLDLVASAKVGDMVTVAPVFLPEDAKDKTFNVTAAPEGIVEILNGGATLKCIAEGSVQITVTSNVSPSVKVTKVLAVEAATVAPRQLTVAWPETSVVLGQTYTPVVTFSPEDTTNKEYRLETTTPNMLLIDGLNVTVKALGNCKIRAISLEDPTVISAWVNQDVVRPAPASLDVKVVSDDFTGTDAKVNDSFTIEASVLPAEADQTLEITFDPTTAVAGTQAAGYHFVEHGDIDITVSSVDGSLTTTLPYHVTRPAVERVMVDVISDDFTGTDAKVGNTFTVETDVVPTGADEAVTISVLPAELAEDLGNLKYKVLAEGEITVKATSVSDTSKSESVVVTATVA